MLFVIKENGKNRLLLYIYVLILILMINGFEKPPAKASPGGISLENRSVC